VSASPFHHARNYQTCHGEQTSYIRIDVLPFDVRDRKQAAAALEALPEEWKSIDVLINNAGLCVRIPVPPCPELPDVSWRANLLYSYRS